MTLIHKYVYADRPYEKASKSIINGTMRINDGARLYMGSIRDQLAWFGEEKLIRGEISPEMLVDPSYVQTVG